MDWFDGLELDVSSICLCFYVGLIFLELDTHCAVSDLGFFFIHQEIEVLLRIHRDFFFL